MIERIIKMSSNAGDTVLDPFLGSGTTVVAAIKLGRKGIGFELDQTYESEILKRIETEASSIQPSLFDFIDKSKKDGD